MFKALIETSVRFRWFVVLVTALVAALGLFELTKLPIDAVPDITNRQVQITTVAPALAPEQIERQVTYPLETAMAGIPGLTSTRSLSRNGFSQITVIFTDQTDIYFARQQVAERMAQARERLPEGVEPNLAPIHDKLAVDPPATASRRRFTHLSSPKLLLCIVFARPRYVRLSCLVQAKSPSNPAGPPTHVPLVVPMTPAVRHRSEMYIFVCVFFVRFFFFFS